jgi:hypothetical protein
MAIKNAFPSFVQTTLVEDQETEFLSICATQEAQAVQHSGGDGKRRRKFV